MSIEQQGIVADLGLVQSSFHTNRSLQLQAMLPISKGFYILTELPTETRHRIKDLTASLVCWNNPSHLPTKSALKGLKNTTSTHPVLFLSPRNRNTLFSHCMHSTMQQQDLWMRVGLFFRRVFDAVSHNILVSQLAGYRWDGWTTGLVKKQLDNQAQKVVVNGSCKLAGGR